MTTSIELHNLSQSTDEGLQTLCGEKIVCRIWAIDHTVWKPEPAEITNRLGWLHIVDAMQEQLPRLESFAREISEEGYTHALLLGMGGSSLAPELFQKTFGRRARQAAALELVVVDTTDPDAIHAAEAAVDLARSLVIVSTKSGGTVETLSAFKHFYNRLSALHGAENVGRHFIGITDPASKIVDMAKRYGFREVFLNDPDIGGRYSALSYFGLIPAALVGVDVGELLKRAARAVSNTIPCECDNISGNPAALIGAAMGVSALAGRDKITFITAGALSSFGDWVEQLIAESLGKEGKGILPVVNEPLAPVERYGADRLFVHMRLLDDDSGDAFVDQLVAVGHPVIKLRLNDLYDIGEQFFWWEMATAIAAYFLQINPFDQPNVESAKVKARSVMAAYSEKGSLPPGKSAALDAATLNAFLEQAHPGDYVSLHAYVQPTGATDAALSALRQAIHLKTGLATTSGYGPRFLHSTGQLHKGDGGNGLFIQFVSDARQDLPIPDEAGSDASSMSFDVLKKAQALGDAEALREAQRRLISFNVGSDAAGAIERLAAQI